MMKSESKWMRLEKFSDPASGYSLLRRVFAEHGKDYPRICISIHSNLYLGPKGIKISVSGKEEMEHWWEDCNLPPELIPQLQEMLEEYKMTTTNTDNGV